MQHKYIMIILLTPFPDECGRAVIAVAGRRLRAGSYTPGTAKSRADVFFLEIQIKLQIQVKINLHLPLC